jgi:hypothetical protein
MIWSLDLTSASRSQPSTTATEMPFMDFPTAAMVNMLAYLGLVLIALSVI